ncbi:MAG: hypothetical protein U0838_11525 [Chloroflexota bacterium]
MDTFEIRIASQLDERRIRQLDASGVAPLADGTSVITFVARDQAAIYGLLARLRDLGVALISIEPVPAASGGREEPR